MIWQPNSESKFWVYMDKSFLILLIIRSRKSIGSVRKALLKILKFKVKIYNSRLTKYGPIMIKWSFQAQWLSQHQLIHLKRSTPNSIHTIWGREKLQRLITGKTLIKLLIQNISKVLNPLFAGLNKRKISNVMELIDLKEPLPRF